MVNDWFLEIIGNPLAHSDLEGNLYFRGFKFTSEGELLDIRWNDFYNDPREEDLEVFRKFGFVDGCAILMYIHDLERLKHYTKRVVMLNQNIDKFYKDKRKKLPAPPEGMSKHKQRKEHHRRLDKRIQSAEKLLEYFDQLLTLYNNRVENFRDEQEAKGIRLPGRKKPDSH